METPIKLFTLVLWKFLFLSLFHSLIHSIADSVYDVIYYYLMRFVYNTYTKQTATK